MRQRFVERVKRAKVQTISLRQVYQRLLKDRGFYILVGVAEQKIIFSLIQPALHDQVNGCDSTSGSESD